MLSQLPLSLIWPDQATFDNFYAADNGSVLTCLQKMLQKEGDRCVYLYGGNSVGLSHLLYATCHAVQQQGGTAAYLPLKKTGLSPQALEGMENLSLVCWDDVESVVGNRMWEEALFHSYNRLQATGTRLLVASHAPSAQLNWSLPDLSSRLAASMVCVVQPLSDAQKVRALQHRAKRRGLDLSDEVGQYLLSHCPRDMQALFAVLEKLDHFSLVTQRRLTIPFVKQVLEL